MIRVTRYSIWFWFLFGLSYFAQAQEDRDPPFVKFPKVAFTYDFNTLFSSDDTHGPRLQLISNHKFFGSNEVRTRREKTGENTVTYAYGVGLGSYTVESLKRKGDDGAVNHFYAMFVFSYRNQSYFEPFFGIYPGFTWGAKSDLFVDPTIGINVKGFHVKRNWNSNLLQTYLQLRVEYQTSLSSVFCGAGVMLQFE